MPILGRAFMEGRPYDQSSMDSVVHGHDRTWQPFKVNQGDSFFFRRRSSRRNSIRGMRGVISGLNRRSEPRPRQKLKTAFQSALQRYLRSEDNAAHMAWNVFLILPHIVCTTMVVSVRGPRFERGLIEYWVSTTDPCHWHCKDGDMTKDLKPCAYLYLYMSLIWLSEYI